MAKESQHVSVVCRVQDGTEGCTVSTRTALVAVPLCDCVQQNMADLCSTVTRLLKESLGQSVSITELQWECNPCDPLRPLSYYLQLLSPAALVLHANAHVVQECHLTIVREGYAAYVVDVQSPFITVAELKRKLWADPGLKVPMDWVLMFGDRMLDSRMDATLRDFSIKNGAHRPLRAIAPSAIRSKGAGMASAVCFADISNAAALDKLGWASEAPAWWYACHGLCIEGFCRNSDCEAYNERVIDNTRGFGHFDLKVDACHCPICKHKFKPETAGFNNCEWKFVGIKVATGQGGAGIKLEHVKGDWQEAGDGYERFQDGDDDNMVQWARLTICTRPPPDVSEKPACSLCMKALRGTEAPAACGHTMHDACGAAWCSTFKVKACPVCCAAIPGAADLSANATCQAEVDADDLAVAAPRTVMIAG